MPRQDILSQHVGSGDEEGPPELGRNGVCRQRMAEAGRWRAITGQELHIGTQWKVDRSTRSLEIGCTQNGKEQLAFLYLLVISVCLILDKVSTSKGKEIVCVHVDSKNAGTLNTPWALWWYD